MVTISEKTGLFTIINVFTVKPEQQQRLVDYFVQNMDIAKKQPGFVSSNIHKSLDGTRVANYAQWRSREDIESALKNPEFVAFTKPAVEFAPHDFHFYEVISTTQAQ